MRILLFFLLLIAACNNPVPTTTDQVADSLIGTLRNELARNYNNRDIKDARQFLDSIHPSITERDHPALLSAWYSYKGRTFIHFHNDSANLYLDTAMRLAELSRSPKAKVIWKMQLVSLLLEQNLLDSALKHALEAVELAKFNPPAELPQLYSQLSYLYRAADDSLNYRKYLFEGLKISKDPMHIAAFSSDIGRYYISRDLIDSAIYFFKNFQQFNEFSSDHLDARKYEDIGHLLLTQGKSKEGIENIRHAIMLHKREGYAFPSNYLAIAIEYNKLENLQKANAYLDTALFIARKNNDLENISNAIFHKSNLLLKQSKHTEAYQLLDSSYIYHLQYDTIAFRNQAKDVETQMMERIKDEKIASMGVAMKATAKISNQRLIIIVALVIIGLFLVVFGVMLARRKKMQMQLREAQLEQQSLRSQMEPHFIFNTLGALQSYIRSGNITKSVDFLDRFSRLLRLSLDNARKNSVLLKDEVAALENYLNLQASQRDNSFDYFIEPYPGFESDGVLMPPMLLQPFVENAILHGFTKLNGRGWITVKITRQQQLLRCIIEDNGVGLNSNTVKDINRSHSTTITKERLRLLSTQTSRNATIEIVDKGKTEKRNGVRVTLTIPLILPKKDNNKPKMSDTKRI